MGTTLGELENPVAGSLGAPHTSAEGPGKEWLFPFPFCCGRSEVATMGSSMPLFFLLALLDISHVSGPKVILKVKLAEVFQPTASQDSSFLGMLQKICLLLHLPSGTNMTLHHKGPPHHLTCRT
ncbi:surfactant-associated protein 2 [Chionomys nivalis]|uniref:surfactant-associated protein 2 n=1 Tax=Chionomys nivalis TaxID=269649 RepID=UPI00259527C4|nr:surfactant-associated protein 2 [Chionomys nivalis]